LSFRLKSLCHRITAKNGAPESVLRIELARLEPEEISNVVAALSAAAARLGAMHNPRTAANLADLVCIINTYYSNLLEGHDTRPRDIPRLFSET
jgi:Fic family protein